VQQINTETVELKKAIIDCNYRIIEINSRPLALKLMEMGCLNGMIIKKVSAAPFKGPIVIKVSPNENLLALRYEEAENIILSQIDN
jgi:Fe2+ transport system protein FeoA